MFPNSSNIYSKILDEINYRYFSNAAYNTDLRDNSIYIQSVKDFNSCLRTYSIDLGRRLGASTAIINFTKKHPELKFLVITTSVAFKNMTKNEVRPLDNVVFCDKPQTLSSHIRSVDVVFFDDYKLLSDVNFFKDVDKYVFNSLNTTLKDQIYIRFQ